MADEPSSGFERMEPIDALMWRTDGDPGSRSTMLGLYLLDDCPDWDRVVETFERASRLVARLRQRVEQPAVLLSSPYWVLDEHFDLSYHVRRVRLSGQANLRELLDFAQLFASSPLDRSRPLWEATLVEGLDPLATGARAALALKSSHSIADGVTAMKMAMAMLTAERERGSRTGGAHTRPERPWAAGTHPGCHARDVDGRPVATKRCGLPEVGAGCHGHGAAPGDHWACRARRRAQRRPDGAVGGDIARPEPTAAVSGAARARLPAAALRHRGSLSPT